MSVGVVIGRFQTPHLTAGHIRLLDIAVEENHDLLILVGEMPTLPNSRNPLPFYVRRAMLAERYPHAVILPVQDARSDEVWSRRVDSAIQTAFPLRHAVLYGGRDSFAPFYSGRHPVLDLSYLNDEPCLSGSDERLLLSDHWRDSEDFRAGMIHATMRLPGRVYPTVDIAVVRGDELLIAQKPGENKWRFPGGFVDPSDASLEAAARRELHEETGLTAESLRYVSSFMINDWRNRGAPEYKVCTSLFLAVAERGAPVASDDIAAVIWQSMRTLDENEIVEEHRPLYLAVLRALNN